MQGWRMIKYEEVYLRTCDSGPTARHSLRRYLAFHNGRRPHSPLERRTPDKIYPNTSSPILMAA
jgi:putative transposase